MSSQPVIQLPSMGNLAGNQPPIPPFVRMPFYPTAPRYSTMPNVGFFVRVYSVTLLYTDSDYVVGSEARRPLTFDIPGTAVEFNGGSFVQGGVTNAFPVGVGPLDCFLVQAELQTSEKVITSASLASAVLGTGQRPGELGNTGITVGPGSQIIFGITPLLANLRVTVTVKVLEARGPTNYTVPTTGSVF